MEGHVPVDYKSQYLEGGQSDRVCMHAFIGVSVCGHLRLCCVKKNQKRKKIIRSRTVEIGLGRFLEQTHGALVVDPTHFSLSFSFLFHVFLRVFDWVSSFFTSRFQFRFCVFSLLFFFKFLNVLLFNVDGHLALWLGSGCAS